MNQDTPIVSATKMFAKDCGFCSNTNHVDIRYGSSRDEVSTDSCVVQSGDLQKLTVLCTFYYL